ncbi:MAG: homoserine kinase [Gammaproteobacteria bacterium]|nr:homoserine kinase [Gammaproteobacteria bacterium]
MSVYTTVTEAEMRAFTARFNLGPLNSFRGVDAGVENTTYFVTLGANETVLQIFEEQTADEIPFFIELNRRLGADHVPVAVPYPDQQGERLHVLKGKPAVLFPRLKGGAIGTPTVTACRQIGDALGRMHQVSGHYPMHRVNHRWMDWWESNVERVIDLVPAPYDALLRDQIARSRDFVERSTHLPSGLIHGDLFCDNALFDNETLSGIIDFYNACDGAFLFDLAVTLNDWCSLPDGALDEQRAVALTRAYCQQRPLTPAEADAWAGALETAALRFWMLRLVALARKREGGPQAPPHVKDPNDFLTILKARRANPQRQIVDLACSDRR